MSFISLKFCSGQPSFLYPLTSVNWVLCTCLHPSIKLLIDFNFLTGLKGGTGKACPRLWQTGPVDIIRRDTGREPLHLPLRHWQSYQGQACQSWRSLHEDTSSCCRVPIWRSNSAPAGSISSGKARRLLSVLWIVEDFFFFFTKGCSPAVAWAGLGREWGR